MQILVTTEMFSLWEELMKQKEEWKFVSMVRMELSVMMGGVWQMQ